MRILYVTLATLLLAGCDGSGADDGTVINVTEVVERITETVYQTVDVWHETQVEFYVVEEDTTPDIVERIEYHYPSGPVPALMIIEEGVPAMADGPISLLPDVATVINDADVFAGDQSGTTKQFSAELIRQSLYLDPRYGFNDPDDFLGDAVRSDWAELVNGAGAAMDAGPPYVNRTHMRRFNTGTTNAGYCTLHKKLAGMRLTDGEREFDVGINVQALSDGANRFFVYAGFGDVATAATDMQDGCYFSYADSVLAGNWAINAANGGTRTQADSGEAVAAATWVTLSGRVNAAGTSVEFFIDGVSVGTINTNLPVASVQFAPLVKIGKTVGTSNRLVHCDFFSTRGRYTTPR